MKCKQKGRWWISESQSCPILCAVHLPQFSVSGPSQNLHKQWNNNEFAISKWHLWVIQQEFPRTSTLISSIDLECCHERKRRLNYRGIIQNCYQRKRKYPDHTLWPSWSQLQGWWTILCTERKQKSLLAEFLWHMTLLATDLITIDNGNRKSKSYNWEWQLLATIPARRDCSMGISS